MDTTSPKAQHTPGPWYLDKNNYVYDGNTLDANRIAGVLINNGDLDTYNANAKLIKAAPLLLEACEAACDYLSDLEDEESQPIFQLLCDALKQAR